MPQMELKDFIHRVRDEIQRAYHELPEEPLLALRSVDLEVSFTLSGTGSAKGKLFVVDVEGEIGHERTHKVTISLVPVVPRGDAFGERVADAVRRIGDLPIAEIPKHKR